MRHARRSICWLLLLSWARLAAADAYNPPVNYYSSATGSGATLKTQLRTIVSTMVGVNYGDARYSAPYTDPDPNVSGNILLMYNRASVSGAWSTSPLIWNREHIWPQSLLGADASNGTVNIASDQFNLRPADDGINSNRGNDPYGLDATAGNHGPTGSYYYPGDADAGDAARSIFYMATRYSQLSLVEGLPGALQMGDLSSLIIYHFKDTPDAFERRRNHAIYGLAGENSPAITNPYRQQNRNPYVDRPELVWSVFVDQANDSRITINGGTTDANGGSVREVNLGRVFTGAAVPAAQNFTLSKAGLDGTYYEVTAAGAATSSLSGRMNAFRTNQIDSKSITVGLNTTTAAAGLKSGTVTVNNLDITTGGGAGNGANDGNDVFDVSLTVLNHSTPSFGGGEVASLMYDFGSLVAGSTIPTFNFDVFNYGVLPAFTANLDFDSVLGAGDTSVLTTNLAAAMGNLSLVGGANQGFTAALDTTTPGDFSATYTLNFSDENITGALNKSLTLTLMGEITAAVLDGDFNHDGFVDASDYTVWRDGLDVEYTLEDYDRWKANFGQSLGSGAGAVAGGSSAVPEPAAVVLMGLAFACCAVSRRR